MKINTKPVNPNRTAEGAPATWINVEQELRRSVMACMLWEDDAYENGVSIAARIAMLVPMCRPEFVAACAYSARTEMKLRHVPLLLVREMARHAEHKKLVAALLADVIQRPDEITEFLAIYWKDGKQPLSAQVKRGLAKAFTKFNEFELAKWNRDGQVKLRDALFLAHGKPADVTQKYTKYERQGEMMTGMKHHDLTAGEELFAKLVDGQLATPDTWEVALSGGADKRETFERLMRDKKLGALAFLRNLRTMVEVGVDATLVAEYAATMKVDRVLPFRFIAAARHAPHWEPAIEVAMMRCLDGMQQLPGRTVLLVDVSGSMNTPLSAKSDMKRLDAATGLAVLLREVAQAGATFSFSNRLVAIPPRRGFALRDAIVASQPHSGTYLGAAVRGIDQAVKEYDRLIVLTDEQSHDALPAPKGRGYVINVATNKRGVGYGAWNHIDGWSESVIDYIRQFEELELSA